MKRILGGVAAAGLLTVSLSACGGGDAEAFCEQGEQITGGIDQTDPENILSTFEDLSAEAPSELEGDFDVITEQLQLVQDGNIEEADTDGLDEAGQNIQTWVEENCES